MSRTRISIIPQKHAPTEQQYKAGGNKGLNEESAEWMCDKLMNELDKKGRLSGRGGMWTHH